MENAMKPALFATLTAFLLVSAAPAAVAQEEMSQEEILAKLKPKKLTRSIKAQPKDESAAELDAVLSRSIGVVERKKIVEITTKSEMPRVDFSIKFGFDSAEIDPSSYSVLDSLAAAMKNQALYESKFLVNGHTDSKGSDEYNLSLSQKRANAVATYLVSQHDIEPGRLKAIGLGEMALKDVNDGESPENRRVEIINRAAN
jgi:outer membrane protein OmpA-like peptidoglycan-associated protein